MFSEIVIVNIVLGTKCMAITNTSVILKPPLPFSLNVRDLESVRRRVGGGLNQTAYQRPRECKDKGGGLIRLHIQVP